MRKLKLNCWEYHNCGREPGGVRSLELGVCPATVETRLEGIHNGNRAGRACWVVSGTMCGGEVQGTFAKKFHNCEKCDFYSLVKTEEILNFHLSATLLSIMKTWAQRKGISENRAASLCSTPADREISWES